MGKLEKLVDLEPLTKLKTLERLSLLENPVVKVKHYRPYMIQKCTKKLRILDFNRIKDKERKAAGLLFAHERGKKLLEEIAPPRVIKDMSDRPAEGAAKLGPSPEVIERIKRAIAEAETIEEVTRLEKALKSGVLPEDLQLDGDKAAAEQAEEDEKAKEEEEAAKAAAAKKSAEEAAAKMVAKAAKEKAAEEDGKKRKADDKEDDKDTKKAKTDKDDEKAASDDEKAKDKKDDAKKSDKADSD